MRIIAATVVCVVSCAAAVSAQSEYGVSPEIWTAKSPPTARSWGMGFAGAALVDEIAAPDNPGSLGIWALSHDALFGSNWSRSPAVTYGETSYELSNFYQSIGMRWTPSADASSETLSLGMLYHRGHARWGPHVALSFFDDGNNSAEELITDSHTVQDWAIGAAIDFGIEIGVGGQWSRTESEIRDWPVPIGDYSPWAGDRGAWEGSFGLIANGHASDLFQRLLHRDSILRLGSFTFDMSASYGGGGNSGARGWAADGTMLFRGLPLASFASAHDRDDDISLSGWEINLMGAFSYRWGDRRWEANVLEDDGAHGRTGLQWSTHGYAFHTQGLSRWAQQTLKPGRSSLFRWVMENCDVYYEVAGFDKGADSPRGLRDVTIREWGLRFTRLGELL